MNSTTSHLNLELRLLGLSPDKTFVETQWPSCNSGHYFVPEVVGKVLHAFIGGGKILKETGSSLLSLSFRRIRETPSLLTDRIHVSHRQTNNFPTPSCA